MAAVLLAVVKLAIVKLVVVQPATGFVGTLTST